MGVVGLMTLMFKHKLFLMTSQIPTLACRSASAGQRSHGKWSVICLNRKGGEDQSDRPSSDLLILQTVAQDVVHVLVEALQAAVT